MYEKPELTVVGDAREVVLGFAPNGGDIDGSWLGNLSELEAETIPDSE